MGARASSPPTCLFRVAAGPRLGFGHLMRARALAQGMGVRPVVSLRGGHEAEAAAAASGWTVVKGADALTRRTVVVIDDPHPRHRRAWVARARRMGAFVVSVHDGGPAPGADLVVSGNLGVTRPHARGDVLSGVQFYLLDRRLADARRRRPRVARALERPRVLVALGGGRHVRALAQPLVDEIHRRCPDASIAVAAGFARARRHPLRRARWLSPRTGLWRALARCDAAVVAGGVTLYEACALGVPAVGLAVVREQRPAIRAFARRLALLDGGGGRRADIDVARAARAVARLLGDAALRAATTARSLDLVDGQGSRRVAAHIRARVALKESRAA